MTAAEEVIILSSDESADENIHKLSDKQPEEGNLEGKDFDRPVFTAISSSPTTTQQDDDNENEQPYFGSDDHFDEFQLPSSSQIPAEDQQPLKRKEEPIKLMVKSPVKQSTVCDREENEDIGGATAQDGAGDEVPAKRRKKRTKEEIEQEKAEKELNKIRRQIQSSKNSKCEQFMFCHVSTRIFSMDESLKDELTKQFVDRGIPDQLVPDISPSAMMRIQWRRKSIDAYMEEGKLQSQEKMELQDWFCCVLTGETFTVLAKTKNGLQDYLLDQVKAHRTREARPTLIVLGKHTIRENNLHSLIFDVYEQSKAQIRFVPDALDFAFVVVQMHRALAKLEKKTEKLAETETGSGAHFAIDKGISEGPGMVADWWARMLEHMHRMSEEQKRAILKAYPNPIKLMNRLLDPTNSPGSSMFLLSEIQMESGRRLGPVLAQKIFVMLTSEEGNEIISSGN